MPILYLTLLTLVCIYAFWRGQTEERVVAATSVVATLASVAFVAPMDDRYRGIEVGVMLVDLVVLGIFVGLALVSRRFWPLWVAGLQLTTSLAHFMKAINLALMPTAYAVAAQFWVYPILIILFVATWRTTRRRSNEPKRAVPAV